MPLPLNSQAPDFTLPSTSGTDFQLSDHKGNSLILFFYPKDFTSGCTKEACSFRDNFARFRNQNIPVFGISTDSLESHHQFRKAHQLPFELLSDEAGNVSKLFKARMPFLNISSRVTYLLDKDHHIAAVHDSLFGAEDHIAKMIRKVS